MRWIIKNPAPTDSRMRKWGDFHVGRCLTKYLQRLGQEVSTEYQPDWVSQATSDVVFVLRGKHPCPRSDANASALHILWNISHPGEVSIAEYESYDLVFVASEALALSLEARIQVPVQAMLQATDPEEFAPPAKAQENDRRGVIFVGNTRDVPRDGVLWAVEAGLPVRIWGRGWEPFVDRGLLVGDYIANEELGELYARSRATLNDHWPDMREHGFVNNRIFDALACGLPVISDWHPALQELFPDEILTYRDRKELEACFERLLLSYPSVLDKTRRAGKRVRREFSYEARARTLVEQAKAKIEGSP